MESDAELEALPVQPGDRLAGKYRVERILGRGAMGAVVAAVHEQLGTRVALKFVLPHMLEQRQLVQRFLREAQAAARIVSEHVVRVLDVGTLETGAPYIVMEYLEGSDLSEVLSRRGPLSIPDAIDCVVQACVAVSDAHRMGIIHRDIKPANLFMASRSDGSPLVKVLDFGIAKAKLTGVGDSSQSTLTHSGAVMGSPAYMSPEQLRSSTDVDARSDVWSMGMTLFELMTGIRAFDGTTFPDLVLSIVSKPPVSLRSKVPHAPAELEAVFTRCFAKEPEGRYQSIGQLAVALTPFAAPTTRMLIERIARAEAHAGIGAQPAAAPPTAAVPHGSTAVSPASVTQQSPVSAATAGTDGAWGETKPPSDGRSRVTTVLVAVLAAAAVGAGATAVVVTRRAPSAGAASVALTAESGTLSAPPVPLAGSAAPATSAPSPEPAADRSPEPAASAPVAAAPPPAAGAPAKPAAPAKAAPAPRKGAPPAAAPPAAAPPAPAATPGSNPLFDRY